MIARTLRWLMVLALATVVSLYTVWAATERSGRLDGAYAASSSETSLSP